MKQNKTTSDFWAQDFPWLTRFDSSYLLTKLLALGGQAGLYILDRRQNVLYWGAGAEQVTGFTHHEMVGKPCLPECGIVDSAATMEAEIRITRTKSGKPVLLAEEIVLKKISQALHDPDQTFAGGWGLLLPARIGVPGGVSQASTVSNVIPVANRHVFQGILSRSPVMQDVFAIIANAAETASTVLVRGESGVGKELAAKAIHDLSVRREEPFLAINCAALSSNLLESELFGHVRGAFTGAIKDHSGLFQRAHGGTLFLDEVAELPLELQAKLLRVLQERNYIPVGGDRQIDTDVRIVAATHRSLRDEVKQGRFREDLMYRLRVVPIFIPPLRERREDISLLLWHFVHRHNAEDFRKIEKIEPQAMRALLDYPWPGNVRELHNVVEYAFAVGRGATLRCCELPPEFRESRVPDPHRQRLKPSVPGSAKQEEALIRQALAQHNGLIAPAARSIGMSRATFWRKRKQYGI